MTSLPQLLAEELDVDYDSVDIVAIAVFRNACKFLSPRQISIFANHRPSGFSNTTIAPARKLVICLD
jgi:hypothetical protein